MEPSEFFHKLTSRYLWLNLVAMLAVIVVVCVGAQLMMGVYTHHGEAIALPDVRKHSFADAVSVLEDLGMEVQVNDTGYVKALPPGTVLEMLPAAGTVVKSGRIIYLTINADNSITFATKSPKGVIDVTLSKKLDLDNPDVKAIIESISFK